MEEMAEGDADTELDIEVNTDNLQAQLEKFAQETAFLKKYLSLRNKCEQIQQANEKLVNRLQHVKKCIKRYKKEKRFLGNKLDEHGDNYRDVPMPVMWEEDQMFHCLRPHPYEEPMLESPSKSAKSLASVQQILLSHRLAEAQQAAATSTKSKKIKSEKEKDPNAPKKPANAFLMFCQTKRTAVQDEYYKENNEEIPNHELTKRLAYQWNNLNPEDKRVYYEMYEKEKERYEREMKEYVESNEKEEVDIYTDKMAAETAMATMELEATIKTEIE